MASPTVSISAVASGLTATVTWSSSIGSGNSLVSRSITGPSFSSSAVSGSTTYTMTAGNTYSWTITLVVYNPTMGDNETATQTVSLTAASAGVVRVYNGSTFVTAEPKIYNGTAWVAATPYTYSGTAWVANV